MGAYAASWHLMNILLAEAGPSDPQLENKQIRVESNRKTWGQQERPGPVQVSVGRTHLESRFVKIHTLCLTRK